MEAAAARRLKSPALRLFSALMCRSSQPAAPFHGARRPGPAARPTPPRLHTPATLARKPGPARGPGVFPGPGAVGRACMPGLGVGVRGVRRSRGPPPTPPVRCSGPSGPGGVWLLGRPPPAPGARQPRPFLSPRRPPSRGPSRESGRATGRRTDTHTQTLARTQAKGDSRPAQARQPGPEHL